MDSRIKVLIVDDHKIMREGLVHLIGAEKDMEVIGEAADGRDAIDLIGRLHPQVVLMDVNMPELNGVESTRHIATTWPDVKIIALSMHEEAEIADKMRRSGAAAYHYKAGPSSALLAAIRAAVVQGKPRADKSAKRPS